MGKNYYLNLILISMLSNSIISCDSQGFLNDESLTDTISLSDQSKKWHPEMGYGLVDAYAAVTEAKNRLTNNHYSI